ncbi:MAG TPA: hypothetical protein VIK61_20080 [Acidimicrobiia bacterium]
MDPLKAPSVGSGRRSASSLAAAGCLGLVGTVALLCGVSLERNSGHFVYALDDPAIHLSIATQLVHHATWGVVAGHFSSSSSSPAWTVLLAAVIGIAPWLQSLAPLLLNLVCAFWCVALLAPALDGATRRVPQVLRLVAAALVPTLILFLPGLVMVGMESILHAVLALLLISQVPRWREEPQARLRLCVLAALATTVRYESIFVVTGVAVALLLQSQSERGWRHIDRNALRTSAAMMICGIAPVIAVGVIDLANGGYFFPNAIMAKSTLRASSGHVVRGPSAAFAQLRQDPLLLALVAAAVIFVLCSILRFRLRRQLPLVTAFLTAVVLHLLTANVAARLGFLRYQTYLVVMGIYVLLEIGAHVELARPTLAVTSCLLAVLLLSIPRISLLTQTPLATSNTYRQRYQLGLFLQRYYDGRPVATTELGYVSLFHDGPVTDLLGLGDTEVLRLRQSHHGLAPADALTRMMRRRGVQVIGAYPDTLAIVSQPSWILVGEWDLSEPLVSARNPLQFWALDESAARQLEANLRSFARALPSHVKYLNRDQLVQRYVQNSGREAGALPG